MNQGEPRYARDRYEPIVKPITAHAQTTAETVRQVVSSGAYRDPMVGVVSTLREALLAAYRAGERQGAADATARAREHARAQVERTLDGIIPLASCPHCIGGRGLAERCPECEGTGNYV